MTTADEISAARAKLFAKGAGKGANLRKKQHKKTPSKDAEKENHSKDNAEAEAKAAIIRRMKMRHGKGAGKGANTASPNPLADMLSAEDIENIPEALDMLGQLAPMLQNMSPEQLQQFMRNFAAMKEKDFEVSPEELENARKIAAENGISIEDDAEKDEDAAEEEAEKEEKPSAVVEDCD